MSVLKGDRINTDRASGYSRIEGGNYYDGCKEAYGVLCVSLCLVGCTSRYIVYEHPYCGEIYSLRTQVIRSAEELEEYFLQDNYITKVTKKRAESLAVNFSQIMC